MTNQNAGRERLPPFPEFDETIQFRMPSEALNLLDLADLARRAEAAGVSRGRIETNAKSGGRGMMRITCTRGAAKFIVDALTRQAADARGDVLFALAGAVKNALDAMAARASPDAR
jgi:hypothetical protein